MAFRNSVKVTMLSPEGENARSYPAQPAFLFEQPPFAETRIAETGIADSIIEESTIEERAAPAPKAVAPTVSNDATPLVSATDIGKITEMTAAEMWHARADALRAMTDTLPSETTRGLMPKIIALYDSFARAEGWSYKRLEQQEQAARETAPALESFDEEFPDDDATLSPTVPAPAWLAFERRPLPSPRRRSMRR